MKFFCIVLFKIFKVSPSPEKEGKGQGRKERSGHGMDEPFLTLRVCGCGKEGWDDTSGPPGSITDRENLLL